MIRAALISDLPALVALEERVFRLDRISRRSFRHLITRANAVTLVQGSSRGRLRGYAIVAFHRGTSLARLYSIAVDPAHRGRGYGRALLRAAEEAARQRQVGYLRLEVREDDQQTQTLYASEGYRPFGKRADYYEDGANAVLMEKRLAPRRRPRLRRVPYHPQRLKFTCGPAALIMAMRAFDRTIKHDETTELRLWREATTIYMTSGEGGTSPHGLALAAHQRGFAVELYVSQRAPLFIDSVRDPAKKHVIELVQDDYVRQVNGAGIPVHYGRLGLEPMRAAIRSGGIPIVLVSTYRLDRSREPHWVVVTGLGETYVYFHDPYVDASHNKTDTDCMHVPVPLAEFERMACYGKARQRAALIVGKREA